MANRRVFISVAEVSGDHHGAALARALKELDPAIECEGLGGTQMRAAGVKIHHETVGRAAMLHKALARSFEVWKLLRWTRELYRRDPPAVHVCIDSSGMNLHFAKLARECGVPVLYYVAPQLWASREGRIKQVRRYVNRVACILPFEEEYYRSRGVEATFVGHPLFDQLPPNRKLSEVRDFGDAPMVGLMPGSRRGEVRANWPHLLEVAERIRAVFPAARFEVPTTPPTDALVREMAGAREGIRIESGAIDALAPGWDFCLAKSGTTTLHVASYGVPMVVVYRGSAILWHLIARWVVKTPSIALVNILAQRGGLSQERIVPEVVPWHGSNEPVAAMAIEILKSRQKREEQRANLLKLVETLDRRGASRHAAEMAIQMMENSPRRHGEVLARDARGFHR